MKKMSKSDKSSGGGMKKMPEDWRVLDNLFGFMKQKGHSLPEKMAGYHIVMEKITKKCLTASDLKRILNLSYRRIHEWEEKQVLQSDRLSKKHGSWRLFSIEDLFSCALLLALKRLKVPISRNNKMVKTIQNSLIIQTILLYIDKGQKTFLYHDGEQVVGFYIVGRDKMLPASITNTNKPIIMIPLNDIFIWLLERSGRDDFRVEIDKATQIIAYYVSSQPIELSKQYLVKKEGEKIVFEMLQTSDQKDDNQNTIPGESKPEEDNNNK